MNEQDLFYNKILNDLDNGTLVLPTLPEVALKVREAVEDPDISAAKLAEMIATDAALSTRLLKVANSPMYRGQSSVETIQTAVSRLGLQLVKNLVTTLVMEQMFKPTSSQLESRLRELWEHSTHVAATSQVLASKQRHLPTDEAMLGGLIHAIGVLPLLIEAEKSGDLLRDAKRLDRLIDTLYPRIGASILKSWGFSPDLIAVANEHKNYHRDSGSLGPDIVDVVQVAVLQNYKGTEKELDPLTLNNIKAFEKLGADTGFSLEELHEDSDAYKEALALFNIKD